MTRNVTYHNPIHQEENTPLVTILEVMVDTKQATAEDSRRASYAIDLTKASFGGIQYPEPGTQWYLKKISGVWALMARAPQQNPQLDPLLNPQPGETYIGNGGTTVIVGDVEVKGNLVVGSGPDLNDLDDVVITTVAVDNVLQYNGTNWVNRAAAHFVGAANTNDAIQSMVTGDSVDRFVLDVDGQLNWGSGSATRDTNLYRGGANILITDDELRVQRAASGDTAIRIQLAADSASRVYFEAGGKVTWGDGTGTLDTNLYREAANILRTDDDFWAANLGRGVLVDVAQTSMTSSIGTTLTVVMTTASATFKANRAYRIEFEGGVQNNTNATLTDMRVYKGTTTTTLLTEFFRTSLPTAGVAFSKYDFRHVKIGGSDVTTAICIAIAASAGTAQVFGSAGVPSILRVIDVGSATAYATAITMP